MDNLDSFFNSDVSWEEFQETAPPPPVPEPDDSLDAFFASDKPWEEFQPTTATQVTKPVAKPPGKYTGTWEEEKDSVYNELGLPAIEGRIAEQGLEVVGALGRGVAEGLTTELPGMVGGAVSFITPDFIKEQGFDIGKDLSDWSAEKADQWFGPADYEGLAKIVYEGSKMLAPSVVPGGIFATGARVLLKVGKLQKLVRAAQLAGKSTKALDAQLAKALGRSLKLASGSVAAMFGLSQAQQTEDTANQRADELERMGRPKEAAEVRKLGQGIAPYMTGGIEAVGEYFGTKYLGKLFRLDEADIIKRGGKKVVTDFLRTLGVETGTEFAQAGLQAVTEQRFGIRPDAHPLAEALEVLGPTAFMTLLTGGLAGGVSMARHKGQLPPPAAPAVPPKTPAPELDEVRSKYEAGEITDDQLEKAKVLFKDDAEFVAGIDEILTPREETAAEQRQKQIDEVWTKHEEDVAKAKKEGAEQVKFEELRTTAEERQAEIERIFPEEEAEEPIVPEAKEPEVVVTDDGFRFERQPDGSYTDGDMVFDDFQALKDEGLAPLPETRALDKALEKFADETVPEDAKAVREARGKELGKKWNEAKEKWKDYAKTAEVIGDLEHTKLRLKVLEAELEHGLHFKPDAPHIEVLRKDIERTKESIATEEAATVPEKKPIPLEEEIIRLEDEYVPEEKPIPLEQVVVERAKEDRRVSPIEVEVERRKGVDRRRIDEPVEDLRVNIQKMLAANDTAGLAELADKLAVAAYYDELMDIKNKAEFLKTFRKEEPLAVEDRTHKIFFDIDNFSWYNDILGHKVGDDILMFIGKILREEGGKGAFRFGGEELLAIGFDPETLSLTAERIRDRLKTEGIMDIVLPETRYLKDADGNILKTYPAGKVLNIDGIGVSYGIDQDLEKADQKLLADKEKRTELGERRPKGLEPPRIRGAVEPEPARGREVARVPKPEEKEEVIPPEPPVKAKATYYLDKGKIVMVDKGPYGNFTFYKKSKLADKGTRIKGKKGVKYWYPTKGEAQAALDQYAEERKFEKVGDVRDLAKLGQEPPLTAKGPLFKKPEEKPAPSKKPYKKPAKPKESKVRTLRGRIKEIGGINFLNYTGELRDMPTAVKYLSRKAGVTIDNAVDQLKSDGWLDKDATVESFLEDLRTKPEILKRDRVTRDVEEKKPHELSPQEKKRLEEEKWEPEAPPEGKYVQMRAEDLPEGAEITIIEGKSREGWDRYVVTAKDSFSVTLVDGETIELKPKEEIEVLRKDLKEAPKEVAKKEKAVEPWKASAEEFIELGNKGKLHKATGGPTPGKDTKANTPISIGEREGYSPEDIVHFYFRRRGVYLEGIADSEWMDRVDIAREEYIVDAVLEGKAVPKDLQRKFRVAIARGKRIAEGYDQVREAVDLFGKKPPGQGALFNLPKPPKQKRKRAEKKVKRAPREAQLDLFTGKAEHAVQPGLFGEFVKKPTEEPKADPLEKEIEFQKEQLLEMAYGDFLDEEGVDIDTAKLEKEATRLALKARKELRGVGRWVDVHETGRTFEAPAAVARNADEVATILQPIGRQAREVLYTVTVDKDGNILEIFEHSKGTKSSATAHPIEVAGHILNIPNATKTYFVHNHPTGDTIASVDDMATDSMIRDILSLRGIESDGMVIGGDKWRYIGEKISGLATIPSAAEMDIQPLTGKEKLAVVETILEGIGKGRIANNSIDLKNLIADKYDHAEGIIFFDAKNSDLGFMPWPTGETIREATAQILAASEHLNASAIAINLTKPITEQNRAGFIGAFRTTFKGLLTMHEVIEQGKSWNDLGLMNPSHPQGFTFLKSKEILYSTAAERSAGIPAKQVIDTIMPILRSWTNFPTVRVVQTVKELPKRLRDLTAVQERKTKGEVEGIYDPTSDMVFLIAGNLSEGRIEDVLRHEAEGHRGLRLLMGTGLDTFLDRVAKDKKAELQKMSPGLDFKDKNAVRNAANEWAARQIEAGTMKPLWRGRLIYAFKEWLRKFVPNLKLTDADIKVILYDVVQNVRTGDALVMRARGKATALASEKVARWHSQMEKVLSHKLAGTGTHDSYIEVLDALVRKGEIKEEELVWSGLKDWIITEGLVKGGRTSKQEILDYLTVNNVRVEEIERGAVGVPKFIGIQRRAQRIHGEEFAYEYIDFHGNKTYYREEDGEAMGYQINEDGKLVLEDQYGDLDDIDSVLAEVWRHAEDEFNAGVAGRAPAAPAEVDVGDRITEYDINWHEPRFVEMDQVDLFEEVSNQADYLRTEEADSFMDEDGKIDEEKLQADALSIAYSNWSDFGESIEVTEGMSDWSIRYSNEGDIYSIYNDTGEFVEQLDHRNVDLGDAKDRVFEILDDMDIAISDGRLEELEEMREMSVEGYAPKYAEHTLMGGKDYRELLLILPEQKGVDVGRPRERIDEDINRLLGRPLRAPIPSVDEARGLLEGERDVITWEDVDAYKAKRDKLLSLYDELNLAVARPHIRRAGFRGSHWDDIENILAHVRFDTRVGPNGEKVLHIAEIQSDWHQTGRREGYKKELKHHKADLARYEKIRADIDVLVEEYAQPLDRPVNVQEKLDELGESLNELDDAYGGDINRPDVDTTMYGAQRKVPAAPFKKTPQWQLLVMKRMVRYAAENGFDTVSWDTGATQFERWGSEEVAWVKHKDESGVYWQVSAKEQVGGRTAGIDIEGEARARGLLKEITGQTVRTKENFKRILQGTLSRERSEEEINKIVDRVWERMQTEDAGTSLPRKEGMESFYDRILRNTVNKFFNKAAWGKAKVEPGRIIKRDGAWDHKATYMHMSDYTPQSKAQEDDLRIHGRQDNIVDAMMQPGMEAEYATPWLVVDTVSNKIRWGYRTGTEAENAVKLHNEALKGVETHTIPVTSEMKVKAIHEGMPLFSTKTPGLTKGQYDFLEEHFPDKLQGYEKSREQIAFEKKKHDLSKDGLKAKASRTYARWFMQEYPVIGLAKAAGEEVAEHINLQIRRLRGKGGIVEAILTSPEILKTLEDSGITEYSEITKAMDVILKPLLTKAEYQDYEQLRIEERNVALAIHRPDIKGVDEQQARDAIAVLEEKYGKDIERLREISRQHREFERQAILRPLVNIGWMSQETYDNIINRPEAEYYASFLREMEDVDQQVGGGKEVIKRLVGSEKKKIPSVEGTIANVQRVVKLVETLRLNKQVAELRHETPDLAEVITEAKPMFTKVKGTFAVYKSKEPKKALRVFDTRAEADAYVAGTPGTIVIKRPGQSVQVPVQPTGTIVVPTKGVKKFFTVPADVGKAMDYYSPEEIKTVIKLLRIPARLLRAGATLSVEFMTRNPVRDQLTAYVYSNYGYKPWNFFSGMFHLLGKSDLYKQYKAAGGEQSYFVSVDRTSTGMTAKRLVGYKKKGRERFATLNPLEGLRKFSEWTEKGTRLGLYAKAIKKGATSLEAMSESREGTLDFGRLGSQGKAINQIVAFWNANAQGSDKMARSLIKNPGRTLTRAFMGITIPSVLLWFINHDDERYKALPDWQKNFFWIISVEGYPLIRIPKPFELGLIFGSLPERILDYVYENDPDDLKSIARAIKDGAVPGIIPTAALPYIEHVTNYSFFRERQLESMGLQKLPEFMRFTPYTTELAKEVGAVTNISPVKLENWIRGWGGTLTMEAVRYMDVFLEDPEVKRVKKHWYEETPGVKGFIARDPIGSAAKHVEDFYKNLKEVSEADAGYKVLKKVSQTEALSFYNKYKERIRYSKEAARTARYLAGLRRQINEITVSKKLTSAEKRTKIDVLAKRISEQAQYFNRYYAGDLAKGTRITATTPGIAPFTPSPTITLREAMQIK